MNARTSILMALSASARCSAPKTIHGRDCDIHEQNGSFPAHVECLENHTNLFQLGDGIRSLFSSFAQRSFQLDVKIAAHLRHSLIAILAKEGRWLIVFKNALASLVLEQNHPERRVKSG